MKERNPFFIKSYEGTESNFEYLQFFNAEALQPIDDIFLESIKYINSSPGAGKTSIFKAFSPSVMRLVLENGGELYQDIFNYMEDRSIIAEGQIQLLPCYISCARNYDAIEDDFSNGRRKQVFFALLNTKIIIACLRALCDIKKLDLNYDLERITFQNIPDEMYTQKEHFLNGSTLFEWACNTESELCRYLDDYEELPLAISFIHTTLLCIKLFESNCICLDKKECIKRTLFIFDDFHKLTENQRGYLTEAFYVLRPKAGVWFGQRFIGLSTNNILLPDGMIGREYLEDRELNLENYWSSTKSYTKLITKIANQRLNGLTNMPSNYEDLLEGDLNFEKYNQQMEDGISHLVSTIQNEIEGTVKYRNIFGEIVKQTSNIDKAKELQILLMLIRRDQNGQMSLDLEELQQEEFKKAYTEHQAVAEYYFKIDNQIPFYYGMDVLRKISSYNIEQFLTFAGSIFDLNKAGKIISGKNFIKVSPEEQEKLFKNLAEQRWNDILQRFTAGYQIQNMVSNLCEQASKEKNRKSNSYTGGTFSGIGIEKNQLARIINQNEFQELREVLYQCISAWYFEKRKVNQGNKEWLVLYYNRWICLKFNLPLVYGGWKGITASKLNECLKKKNVSLSEDYEYATILIGE